MINAIGKVIKGVCSLLSPPLLLAVGVVVARKVLASNPQVSTKETAGSSVHYPDNKQAKEHQAKDSATTGKSAQQCYSGDGIASAEESRISVPQNDPCIAEDNALLLPQPNTSASPSNSGEPLTDEVCAGNSNGGEVDQDVHFSLDSLQYNDCKVFSPSNTHTTNDDLLPVDSRTCSPDETDLHASKERSEPDESGSSAHVQCESPLPEDSRKVSPATKPPSAENKGTGAECSACPQPTLDTPDDTLCVDLPETSSCLLFTGASNVYRCDETVKSHLLYGPPLLVSKPEHIVGCSSHISSPLPIMATLDIHGNVVHKIYFLTDGVLSYLSRHRNLMITNPSKDFTRSSSTEAEKTLRQYIATGMRGTREILKDSKIIATADRGFAEWCSGKVKQTDPLSINIDNLKPSRHLGITSKAHYDNLDKISEPAIGLLFRISAFLLEEKPVFKGRDVFPIDGTEIRVKRGTYEPDEETHCDVGSKKGYDSFHLITLFWGGTHSFRDYILMKMRFANERKGLSILLDRNPSICGIFLLDRGFAGYNSIALLSNHSIKYGSSFLMRINDDDGMIRTLVPNPPGNDEEWDKTVTLTFARNDRKEYRDKYQSEDGSKVFVPIDKDTEFSAIPLSDKTSVWQVKVRIVRLKVGNGYETLITNLDYTLEELRELYGLRWGTEVAYKLTKSEIGLAHLHHKRIDRIAKEICIRLFCYNLVSAVVYDDQILERVNKDARFGAELKHKYRPNFISVACDMRRYLLQQISLSDLLYCAIHCKSPVRPGRDAVRSKVNSRPIVLNAPAV